jgi:hypothetical protein
MEFAEAYMHEKFKKFRVKGEWFRIEPAMVLASFPEVVRRAAIYDEYCHAWHLEATEIRATDEYQAKARREYKEFLEDARQHLERRIDEIQSEVDGL